jgi:hypothetical protein
LTGKPESRTARNYRIRLYAQLVFLGVSLLLTVISFKYQWHWAYQAIGIFAVLSSLIGVLSDLNAMIDRRKS